MESRGGEVILGAVRAPLSSHCSLAHQQRLSPFTAEEVRLRERWWLFQGHTTCEGQSRGSNPDSRPRLYKLLLCSASQGLAC